MKSHQSVDGNELVKRARQVRSKAYAPYSHYAVGAAIQTQSGKIFTGVNVENASYGLTVCAERNAVFQAVAAGEKEIQAVAVVTKNGGTPCGACRQVLGEFANGEMLVWVADARGRKKKFTLKELLPARFSSRQLKKK